MVKTFEYKAKGHNGEKVYVPAKYSRIAKGLVKDVLKLKDEEGLPKMLAKYDYGGCVDILKSVRDLLKYNTSGEASSKQKFQELKENVYLRVCSYGASKMNDKKVKKVRKKSDEEIRKISRENSKIQEKIQKILRDN